MFGYLSAVSILSCIAISLQDLQDVPGQAALASFPLIDGHNDLAYNLLKKLRNQIDNFAFDTDLSTDPIFGLSACKSCNTDLARLKKGNLGAQFWAAFVDCPTNSSSNVVSQSFEQVDVIKRLINKYSEEMELVTTADGIEDAFLRRNLASLIGLEGGHSIDSRLSLLRQFYDLGVRYMTLTQACSLPWADASVVDDKSHSPIVNLTAFGKKIILEMNRLGMMVDLSHVSYKVMSEAIDVSKAPVIFSHSSAYNVYPHHRNVRDDVLRKVKENGGIVMVNFYSKFLGEGHVTIRDVIKHINHIVDVAGIDHVGIGSDFDGVDSFPEGLEDVSKYPALFDLLKELDPIRWTIENLEKLAGKNFVRVFKKVEEVRDRLLHEKPDESLIPEGDLENFASKQANGGSSTLSSEVTGCLIIVIMLFLMK